MEASQCFRGEMARQLSPLDLLSGSYVIPAHKSWSSGAKNKWKERFYYSWGRARRGKSRKGSRLYLFDLLSGRLPGPNPEHPWGGESISVPPPLFLMWHHGWATGFSDWPRGLESFATERRCLSLRPTQKSGRLSLCANTQWEAANFFFFYCSRHFFVFLFFFYSHHIDCHKLLFVYFSLLFFFSGKVAALLMDLLILYGTFKFLPSCVWDVSLWMGS